MKKIVFLLLASFLVLSACGNEESKLEDKKETKASDKESNKDDKKKDDEKESDDKEEKSDDKSNEEVATQDETTEPPVQSQEQVNTQEQPVQQEPIDEEQWARENIEGGTDAHAADEMEAFYQQERAKELEKEQKADAINEKMEDPSLSKDEYNELVYEFNDLHDE